MKRSGDQGDAEIGLRWAPGEPNPDVAGGQLLEWANTAGVVSGNGEDVCRGGPGTDSAASCEVIKDIP